MSRVDIWLSGVRHGGIYYFNADQVIIALYKAGYKDLASNFEKILLKMKKENP